MKAAEIHAHFQRQGTWVDWSRSTDGFKAGDPERDVKTVAVAWKANWEALRQAADRGAELLVTHESIAVQAVNDAGRPDAEFALPSEASKFSWLAASGLTVYRCHDVWDRFAELGIRDTWQRQLKFDGEIVTDAFPLYVTQIRPVTAQELARQVAGRVAPLGQQAVLLSGDPDARVTRVATGTGVSTDPPRMMELGADAGIITDDYYLHVRMGEHARELGFPTITVNHGVAEEWGIANLARYLQDTFPELQVFHLPQQCPYRLVGADG
jgi:putative NIF3 family GTP cyclohydrolase 1 type 2